MVAVETRCSAPLDDGPGHRDELWARHDTQSLKLINSMKTRPADLTKATVPQWEFFTRRIQLESSATLQRRLDKQSARAL